MISKNNTRKKTTCHSFFLKDECEWRICELIKLFLQLNY